MGKKKNKKRNINAAESSSNAVLNDKKTPEALKAKGELAKKSSNLKSSQTKEAETTPQAQPGDNDKKAIYCKQGNQDGQKDAKRFENMNNGNKETGRMNIIRGKVNGDAETENSLGGVIFMCNAKTKADCFRYRVLAVPISKLSLMMRVKPGLKLFLYDIDLRLMYGIYEASSAGGMKLEPAAFGGGFPAQVRFRIHKDCLPLPKDVFTKAINCDKKTHKFQTELTVQQVEQLTMLFRPVLVPHPTVRPALQDYVPDPAIPTSSVAPLSGDEPFRQQVYGAENNSSKAVVNNHERQQFADHHVMPREVSHRPLFLTEKEYRTYGLQQAKHMQPTASETHVDHKLDHHGSEHRMEHLLRNPASVRGNAALVQNGTFYSDTRFPSEREYQTYGLKGRSGQHVVGSSTTVAAGANHILENHLKSTCNPYDESTASLVNRYLSMPQPVVTPREPPLTGREYFASNSYYAGDIRGHPGRLLAQNERVYLPHAPHALSEYTQNYHHHRDEPGYLSRYPFPGPSAPRP